MKEGPKKILVVEDALMVGLHIKKSLEYVGYEVLDTVTNGAAALERALELHPDLILMDIMLEGDLDGIETAQLIRQERNVPIIYLTALSDIETIRRAKITDPFGYIMKPFNERELHTNIEMALHKAQSDQKLRASEAKFYSAVRSIQAFLFTLDADFKVTYANPSVLKLFRKTQEEIYLEDIRELMTLKPQRENGGAESRSWFQTLKKKGALEGDFFMPTMPEVMYSEFRLAPLSPSEGEASGYLFTFQDVTAEYRNKQLEREMERRNLAMLIEGQEQERTRVARDLHDSLGQMLSGIKLYVESSLKNDCVTDEVKSLQTLLEEAIQETRRISENLIPIHLQELPLRNCVSELIKSVKLIFQGEVTFESIGPIIQIEQGQKIGIYRIVQEALNNAVKYAEAETIQIQLVIESSSVDLTIEDDGKGFQQDSVFDDPSQTHHGLQNMKDRALIMNGELSIESSKALGTLIHLTAPITPTSI